MRYPRMIEVRQRFARDRIDEPVSETGRRIVSSGLIDAVSPGMKIAVAAGSRGIHHYAGIVASVVESLKNAGAAPFIVPAMGSHGGGTADGQRAVLAGLGIDEARSGAPLETSIETVRLGETPGGAPVWCARSALDADAVVLVNRVKIHTAFHGRVESGLCKMAAVGLGKKEGAEAMHGAGLGEEIAGAFRLMRGHVNFLFGVALLENARDEICDIAVVPPGEFEATDAAFLERSREIVPRIPLDAFDILIVDEMGKNISGTGMDTNVIGFWRRFGGVKEPDYTTLVVLGLTPESHGNAMGIGLADLVPRRLVDDVDYDVTWTNAMTSQWSLGRIPITLDTDKACIDAALRKHGGDAARVVRIPNTLNLETVSVSENLLSVFGNRGDIVTDGPPVPLGFDARGCLLR